MGASQHAKIRSYRDLEVWRRSYELALRVYRETQTFPVEERFGLVTQLRRAAVSVPANIAEGHARQHRQEYVQFLYIAQGSAAEAETLLRLSKDLGYLDEAAFVSLWDEVVVIGRMLARLLSALAKGVPRPTRSARTSGQEGS